MIAGIRQEDETHQQEPQYPWFFTAVVYVPAQLTDVTESATGFTTAILVAATLVVEATKPRYAAWNSFSERSENRVTPCTAVPPDARSLALRRSTLLRKVLKCEYLFVSSAVVAY